MKQFLFFIFLTVIFSISLTRFSNQVFAAEDFTTKYDLTYEVALSGVTTVIYRIGITNLTTQYYISEYELIIPSTKIDEIIAFDPGGKIAAQINKEENDTRIHLVFNTKVIGKDNTLVFTLSYQSPEVAQKNGRIWEINIPPRSDNPQIIEYNVKLKFPKNFGQPAYIFPKPSADFIWTKEQMTNGVSVAFGDYQLFKYNLKYHLANTKLFPFYTEIALPSDNSYQQVKINEIRPKPVSLRQDEDGNWLARYDLSPGEKIDIQAEGLVKISSSPDLNFQGIETDPSKYLSGQNYWEVNDGEIQKLSQNFKTPKDIYDYVVSNLKYDYQKAQSGGKRLGAKGVIQNPKNAICMEFTDLFIALSRAAGIPAREIDGFAFTTNPKLRPLSIEKDILHAWPQYWDKERKTWVMVDPTWGNTTNGTDYFNKLDFNHFALAIRGLSSEQPIPAGGYKLDGKDGKDVEVEISSENWQDEGNQYDVSWNLPSWVVTGLGFNSSVKLKNKGTKAIYIKQLLFDSSPADLLENPKEKMVLAPGESKEINLKFKTRGIFEGFKGVIFFVIDDEKFSKPFTVHPLGWIIVIIIVMLSIIIGAIIAINYTNRRRSTRKSNENARSSIPKNIQTP